MHALRTLSGWLSALDPPGLTPHGFCLTWNPGLLWLEGASDTLIFLAYFSIPLTLIRLIRARPETVYSRIGWLFVCFILACGGTHALGVLTLFVPAYGVEGALKAVTALLSVGTALVLARLMPAVLAMPSRRDMTRLNGELHARIAEQERTAAALLESQTRLLLAQEVGQVGSWDMDLAGDAVFWSATQHALYGQEPCGCVMTRQAWLDLLTPDDQRLMSEGLQQAIAQDRDFKAEFRLALADGTVRWLAERGRVVSSESSGAVRMVGVCVDITERKRLAERNRDLAAAARRGEVAGEQLRVLFEHSPDALFVLRVERPDSRDESGSEPAHLVFETFNPAAERSTGVPAAAFLGRRLEEVVPPASPESIAACRACLDGDDVVTFASTRTVHGRKREFETLVAPIRDPLSGRVERIIGASRDATERLELEARHRHVARAEATNRLTAGIAHDFNNLLQALMGGLEMLLVESHEPLARGYAETALQAAQRGAELTHRLLAFSRQQTLQPQPVDIGKLLGSVGGLLEHTLPSMVLLRLEPPASACSVLADPGQLEAALVNLVVNAAEAMPAGGEVVVGVSTQAPPPSLGLVPGAYAALSVADAGIGMDPATLQQCCEPFFTTKGPSGSGLGLSMVQGFARQSGGELMLRSSPGEGTQALVWLPCAAVAPAPPAPVDAGSAHVLLVDDAPDVLVIAGAFLNHTGLQVSRVDSGQRALDYLEQGGRCDILVSDFAMPGLNGFELVERVRAMRPGLPALVITGFDQAMMSGGTAGLRVLQKPFSRLTLLSAVDEVLHQAQQVAPPRHPAATVAGR